MKGDYSTLRRWPTKHYSSVRMQQGRVQLDADWNDQVEIQNHLSRTEAADVIVKVLTDGDQLVESDDDSTD